jgi:hypothetical protein
MAGTCRACLGQYTLTCEIETRVHSLNDDFLSPLGMIRLRGRESVAGSTRPAWLREQFEQKGVTCLFIDAQR